MKVIKGWIASLHIVLSPVIDAVSGDLIVILTESALGHSPLVVYFTEYDWAIDSLGYNCPVIGFKAKPEGLAVKIPFFVPITDGTMEVVSFEQYWER